MPKVGDMEVRICRATGKPIEMEYVGQDEQGNDIDSSAGANGNPGWLCLHEDEG